MSQLIARLVLSALIIPLATLVYSITAYIAFRRSYGGSSVSEVSIFTTCSLVSWAFIAICWVGLWRHGVVWSTKRKCLTVIWPFATALIGVLTAFGFGAFTSSYESEVGYFFASASIPLIWLIGTILIWRETSAERDIRLQSTDADAITCAVCGYNLTGLTEARCPECGTTFTLSDLFGRQPKRNKVRQEQELSG